VRGYEDFCMKFSRKLPLELPPLRANRQRGDWSWLSGRENDLSPTSDPFSDGVALNEDKGLIEIFRHLTRSVREI
jgi:hypothetical protein